MKKQSRIAIAAARSGGHIIPGMTLAHQYCVEHPETSVLFFSTSHSFDQKLISEHTWPVQHIALSLDNVPRHWYQYPLFLAQFIVSLAKSIYYLARQRPNHVILMGGYISIPVGIAAMILRIPRELYELNAIPGSATKLLAPLATKIHVCFQESQRHCNSKKTVVSPYPLRFDNPLLSRAKAHESIGLDAERKTILILGGSQGSVSLNKVLYQCLQENIFLGQTLNIIHQTGAQDSTDWSTAYKNMGIPAIVFGYHHDLSVYYQAADIVIGRAGAGTIFETLFFSKPCILIPLEIAGNDHQLHNAQAIARQYPATFTVIRQQELAHSTQVLAQTLLTYTQIPTTPSPLGSDAGLPVNSSI